ncbi:uncharacterized protein LOC133172683 [Saccostrea echinata]|uniref:uncharacterized protein LOC133172683 n=1 Tax=Saccostrea echinata TaxID=191078 RepID=UPI002A83F0A1|nr:uncharacterized protein LOC133172683 [Saccostrea echinata]
MASKSTTTVDDSDNRRTQRPELERSNSLDPKCLQRAPSFQTITEFKERVKESEESKTNSKTEQTVKEESMMENPDLDEKDNDTSQESAQENSEIGKCIECVKAIPVFSSDGIEAGDHVIFSGAVYDHHGIIISRLDDGVTFEIIEATNTFSGVVVGLSKLFGGKAKIQSTFKKFDFEKEKICVVEYRYRRYSKKETIQRAINIYNDKEESVKYKYDLFDNNCEHFATHCVTGQNFSVQVTKFRLTWKLFWSRGFVGISNELTRNEKEFENKIICKDCYEMNKKLLAVTLRPVVGEQDVEMGDIIRYSYYNLWHEAVVLEKKRTTEKSVVCTIAHYAFCGIFSHRTIKEEELEICYDGKCSKLEYTEPSYHVYNPDKVVKRARTRLGEQMFVFFSNDSSHFARWCKLKLTRT